MAKMKEADHQHARELGLVEVPEHLVAKIETCKTEAEQIALIEEIEASYRATVRAAKAFVAEKTGRSFPELGEDHTVIMKTLYRLKKNTD